jgi:hypothetical protein
MLTWGVVVFFPLPGWGSFHEVSKAFPVTADRAVLELDLPPGAILSIDGRDRGAQRSFEVGPLGTAQQTTQEVVVRLRDGRELRRTVLLQAGWHVRLPLRESRPKRSELTGPLDHVLAVIPGPDRIQVADRQDPRKVGIWHVASGIGLQTALKDLPREQGPPLSPSENVLIAFSPNARHVVYCDGPRKVGLWDAVSGLRRTSHKEQGRFDHCIEAMAWSPDSTILFIGTRGRPLLWTIAVENRLETLPLHHEEGIWVQSVAWSPDSQRVAAGGVLGKVLLWAADSRKPLLTLRGHDANVRLTAWNQDGSQLLTGDMDGTVLLWDTTRGKILNKNQVPSGCRYSGAFSPVGPRILTWSSDGSELRDAGSGKKLRRFPNNRAYPSGRLVYGEGGERFFYTLEEDRVRLWDLASGDELTCLASAGSGRDWLALTPEGFFDGSAGGRRLVVDGRSEHLKQVPLDQYLRDFCRPGLVRCLLRGERP